MLPLTEVFNAGISGSDPVYAYMAYKQKLYAYKPNVVTLAINSSDLEDIITRGGTERFLPDSTVQYKSGPWWQFAFARMHLVRLWVQGYLRLDFLFMTKPQHDAETQKAIHTLETCIDSFATLCTQNNTRLLLVFHPIKTEVENGRMSCAPIMQYAQRKGYECVDVLQYFKNNGVTPATAAQYYWPLDGHNNKDGYTLIAAAIHHPLMPKP